LITPRRGARPSLRGAFLSRCRAFTASGFGALKVYVYFAPPPQSDPQSIGISATPMSDLFRGGIP
jgi:hypothetical protein